MLLAMKTDQDVDNNSQRMSTSSTCESPTSTAVCSSDVHLSDYYTIAAVLDDTPDDNNDVITSFSNPNYGLDAINSNSKTNGTGNDIERSTDNANGDIDNHSSRLIHVSKSYQTAVDNGYLLDKPFTPFQQVDVGSSGGSCSADSDEEEDSCTDSAVATPTVPRPRSPRQRDVMAGAITSLTEADIPKDVMTSSLGSGSKENSVLSFRDVYSPDSNDSGIMSDEVRGRRITSVSGCGDPKDELQLTTPPPSPPETIDSRHIRDIEPSDKQTDITEPSSQVDDDDSRSDTIDKLPIGWEKHEDESGAYYWHIKSGTIQRERPTQQLKDNTSKASKGHSTFTEELCSDAKGFGTATAQSPSASGDYDTADEVNECYQCTQLDNVDEYPIRFAVRSLGWIQMSDDELTAEQSSKAVNRCIVGLSVGKNDLNDVVGRWGDGKSLYLELDEENVTLIDPQDLSILNVQPIQSIRVWGVGRNNGRERDFAYVARDCATRKHMCHVFRCDGLARHIANALRDICKKILSERALRDPGTSSGTRTPESPTADDCTVYRSGIVRPTNLPNLSRVGGVLQTSGEQLTFESIYKNTSFPTPMEEPKKVVCCHYLGTTQVLRPAGMDVLNNAMDNVYTRALPEKWVYVNVAVAPSTITITEHGKPENVFAECRVRFLSFMGIAMNNVRLCAFIMHCAQDQFVAHVFHCDPSASALCKTIEAACKLRYQKCLDAHSRSAVNPSHAKRCQIAGRESKGLRLSIQSVLGNLTKGCKP